MAREAGDLDFDQAASLACGFEAGGDCGVDMDSVQDLLRQLSAEEGEIFNGIDKSNMHTGLVACAFCGKSFHETDLLEGRHEVKVLSCFHSVCAACLQNILSDASQEGVACPLCSHRQKKLTLHAYLPHFEAHSTFDRHSISAGDFFCEECVQGGKAEAYCEDCTMHMCGDCRKQHQRAKATVHHSVVSLMAKSDDPEEASQPMRVHRAQYCAIHRAYRYEFYCEDCDMLVCQRCVLDAHQSHSYKLPTASLIERQRARIGRVVESLCEELLSTQSVLQETMAAAKADELRASKVQSEIVEACDQLDLAADARWGELRQDLHNAAADRRQGLDVEKSQCSMAIVDIWRTIDFMVKLATRGTDVEVMQIKTQLQQWHDSMLQRWREITQRALPPSLAAASAAWPRRFAIGWRSAAEAKAVLDGIASFGVVLPRLPPHRRAGGPRGPLASDPPAAPRALTGALAHASLASVAAVARRSGGRCSWADLALMDDEGEGDAAEAPADARDRRLIAWRNSHS